MQSMLPPSHWPKVWASSVLTSQRWLLLLLLSLSSFSAWAQTQSYIIGTNQTTCAGSIYDSGGASGDYQSGENLTTVLTPATAGAKIRLTFLAFDTEDTYDYLRIYNGPTSSSPLLGAFTGSNLPNTITASNAAGQLTLVFTSDGSVTGAGFEATVSCAVNLPDITSFTPTSGAAGTTVVLTGTNFTGATAVSFNGTAATSFTVNSATQITATVPANALSGPITVTTPNGTGASATSFDTGSLTIGTDLTTCGGMIYDSGGPNFDYQVGENLTTVLTPATAGAKIRLTFSAFDTDDTYDYLRIYNGPTSNSPLLGAFTGSNLPNTITASNATGQLTLVFTSSTFSLTASGFAAAISCAVNLPDVTSFTPTSGTTGTTVVLTGTNFTGATAVSFNGTASTSFTVNSATQITATVPANALSGPITVTTPNGNGTSAADFNTGTIIIGANITTCSGGIYDSGGANGDYQNSENLTTVLTPATAAAKMRITFASFDLESGYDFLTVYDGATTTAPVIGSYSGNTNPGTITASNATGQLTLVFTSDGSVTRSGFAASVVCATNLPNIDSFTPTSGAAGTTVVITGTNFTGTTSVSFNGTNATTFTVDSPTQITVTAPANALSGPISITTGNGTTTSAGSYNTGVPVYLVGTDQSACSGYIFDSGGPNGNYQNSENLATVLTPNSGSAVQLDFTSFNLDNFGDGLSIYDGNSIGDPLIGTYSGTTSPGTVTATSATGQLLLVFSSDGFTNRPGFGARISCVPLTCTRVLNLRAGNITPATANLTFTPGIGNTTYTVTYIPTAGGISQTATGTGSPIALSGLTASTEYTVSIQPACAVGTAVSTSITFVTPPTNDEPTTAVALAVAANCTAPTQASTVGATPTTPNIYNVPGCGLANSPRDVWFSFTTAATGAASNGALVNVSGAPAGEVRAFRSANGAAGPFTGIACSAGSSSTAAPGFLVSGLLPSTTYYLAVADYAQADAQGAFTICVTAPPASVSSLNIANLTTTSANLVFTAPAGATGYTVTYTSTTGSPITITGASSPISLTGLAPNTTYTVTVVANYAGGVTSPVVTTVFTTTVVSGTQSAIGSGKLSIYPNPAQRSFTLTLPAVATAHTAQATLLNSLGQAVLSQTVLLNANGTQTLVETSGLASGVYTLRVQAGSQVATAKVIINN